MPTRANRGDGSAFYVELSFAIVTNAEGVAIGALAHARDISERWASDRENRRRLKDLETRLAALEALAGVSPAP